MDQLESEIENARKIIITDGYDMSVGEIMNLYRDSELIIDPEYQRLYRWDHSQKNRFIETLLLGIPVPPIFVMQDESGVWELIDGLQRLSTILEFTGVLRAPDDGQEVVNETFILAGTEFLPSLAGKRWEPSSSSSDDGIGKALQLQIRRSRLKVEILTTGSNPVAKYELFQRLNTGGSALTPQEVRNCIAFMLNKSFFDWLKSCAKFESFVKTIAQTEDAIEKQMGTELALRFFSFRNIPYDSRLDVHEYLDSSVRVLAGFSTEKLESERLIFERTFGDLCDFFEDKVFRRYDVQTKDFRGKFVMSAFEVIAIGYAGVVDKINYENDDLETYLANKVEEVWRNPTFIQNSGAGVRGTTRLSKLLPLGNDIFKPIE